MFRVAKKLIDHYEFASSSIDSIYFIRIGLIYQKMYPFKR